MQPRSEEAMDSAVKQTVRGEVTLHGNPRSDGIVAPTGTMAVEKPCGLHGPPWRPAGTVAGAAQLQLA